MPLSIPVILGTAREGRKSGPVAEFVAERSRAYGFETELIDVKDHLSNRTARVEQEGYDAKGVGETLARADGYVIVSPEYNHGYPGELKIFLDHFYPEFHRKPVGICGVSAGMLGGARMVEVLRLSCIEFHMVPIRNAMYFSKAGDFEPDAEKYGKFLETMFDELSWYAKALKTAREAAE